MNPAAGRNAPSAPVHKVFIGCTDIASLIHDFTEGFREIGVEVLSLAESRSAIQGGRCDYELEDLVPRPAADATAGEWQAWQQRRNALLQEVWQRAIHECDTFLFLWNSFRPDYSDLAELKRLGKRVVWWFVGSDSRWKPAYDQDGARYGLPPLHYGPVNPTAQELFEPTLRLRMAEALADVVVNTPTQCALALRPYFDAIRSPVAIGHYPHVTAQRDRPVLLHAPSNVATKGTARILEVLEELRAEGLEFDLRLLDRVPHAEAIAAYAEVDILVGQLGALTHGKQDRELMACGKVVVGGPTASSYPQRWPDDCPAVPALTPDDLRSALRAIIPDVARRRELAARGRAFVARQNDPAATCARLVEAIRGEREPDFVPDFFRRHFVPENAECAAVHNLGISLVQPTEWYGRVVPSGVRDGLQF